VLAGSYIVRITATGFRREELTGVEVLVWEVRDPGNIVLALGEVREAAKGYKVGSFGARGKPREHYRRPAGSGLPAHVMRAAGVHA
jgi:hypothetical protein